MEPLHISESGLAKDMRSILKRVETGGEVIIELTHPVAVIRPPKPARRKIAERLHFTAPGRVHSFYRS